MFVHVTRVLRLMKAILSYGCAVFVALTISATADDLRVAAARSTPSAFDWTGLYIGLNAGYGFGKSQTDALFSDALMGTPLFATNSSSRLDGLIAGMQAGYNWQAGGRLFGLETDIQATNQHAGPSYVCPGAMCNAAIANTDMPVTVAHDHKLDWFATARARAGVAITPDTLIYATGGVAFAGIWNVGTVFDFHRHCRSPL